MEGVLLCKPLKTAAQGEEERNTNYANNSP